MLKRRKPDDDRYNGVRGHWGVGDHSNSKFMPKEQKFSKRKPLLIRNKV